MALTVRAALVMLGIAVVTLISPAPAGTFVIGIGALVVLVGVDLVLAGSVRALVVERSGPSGSRLREPVEVALTVTNRGGRRVRALVRDAWPPSAGARPRVHRVSLPAGERRRLLTTLVPVRRGDRSASRVTVRSLGPLGLAGRQGRHLAPCTIRVLPPFASRRILPEKLAQLRLIEGQVAVRGRGRGAEFDSLREYVPGDDVRSIDWRSSARRQEVQVRTYRPERDRRIVLVLDSGRTSAGRVGDSPRLDHAMDAVQLLAALAAKAGDRVDLVVYDRGLRALVPAGTTGSQATSMLPKLAQAMSLVEPALVEVDHRGLVGQVLRRTRRRSLVVLFTDLNAAVVEEGLLPVLATLTAKHTVLVAALGDPRVSEMQATRGESRGVYDAAAAERTLEQRRGLSDLLLRRGVEVVDAPPAEFASAVADTYLALKAAGRL